MQLRHFMEARRDGNFFLSDGKEVTRAEARAAYRAGSLADGVRFHARVFTHGKNKNHFVFPDSELATFAASFVDRPLLKDHDWSQDSVGGTILESTVAEHEGKPVIRQLIEAVKPWALEGVLDGTVKRFSIGWDSQKAMCTACEVPIMSEACNHMPWDLGTVDKKTEKLVEVRFEGNEGIEVSAVVNPASPGTGVEILKAMSEKKVLAPAITLDKVEQGERGTPMKEWLVKLLGVPPETDEAGVKQALEAKLAVPPKEVIPVSLLAALGLKPEASADEAIASAVKLSMPGEGFVPKATHDETVLKMRELEADVAVSGLLATGKLIPALKEWAKELALKNPEGFKAFAGQASTVTPVAVVPPIVVTQPNTSAPANPGLRAEVAARMGVTEEELKATDERFKQRLAAEGR